MRSPPDASALPAMQKVLGGAPEFPPRGFFSDPGAPFSPRKNQDFFRRNIRVNSCPLVVFFPTSARFPRFSSPRQPRRASQAKPLQIRFSRRSSRLGVLFPSRGIFPYFLFPVSWFLPSSGEPFVSIGVHLFSSALYFSRGSSRQRYSPAGRVRRRNTASFSSASAGVPGRGCPRPGSCRAWDWRWRFFRSEARRCAFSARSDWRRKAIVARKCKPRRVENPCS